MLSRVGNATSRLKQPAAVIVADPGDVADRGDVQVPEGGGLPPRAFRRVLDYVHAHLSENIDNRVLAELVGLSHWYFVRAFKRSASIPPHRFVLQSRVERVKSLLVETDLPVAEIAVMAGFADQSHCSRSFRKLIGMTPSKFRWLRR